MDLNSLYHQQYRQAVEQLYGLIIQQLINQGQQNITRDLLLYNRLQLVRPIPLGWLSAPEEIAIEFSFVDDLLDYVQAVKQVQHYQLPTIGPDLLEQKRQNLGLQRSTALLIRALFLPPYASAHLSQQQHYQAKLSQYDQAWIAAVRREGLPLQATTYQELRRLQLMLDIANEDVIPPEQIRSAQNKVNYTRLWRMLKAQNWKAANEETQRLMIEAVNRRDFSRVRIEDIAAFPCVDLQTIDQLWVKFSDGHFGFSVQQQLWWWYRADASRFAHKVGWFRNNIWTKATDLEFSLYAERGHLPALSLIVLEWQWDNSSYMAALTKRLESCPLVAA